MAYAYAVVAVWAVVTLLYTFRADFYDLLIVHMTAKWYKAVFERLKSESRLLDVGVGTATALARNAQAVKEKKLVIVGIDYESKYIAKAAAVAKSAGLERQLKVHCKSIYDEELPKLFSGSAAFDAAYFSGSLTLMPDPPAALQAAASMLKKDGLIYITQTFQNRPSPLMERLKPALKYLTTVDFGRVTYKEDVHNIVESACMEVLEDKPIPGSIDTKSQTARLLIVRSKKDK
uniref:Methyltransferase domain-containing protein n=1 Tax=Alexandrium catenella TaxID=2925 RepID=A0A7S1MGI9_ALECA